MNIGKSSDTSAETNVYLISNEIEPVFLKLEEMYPNVNLSIFYVFRSLPDCIKRKSNRRYVKSENCLYLDLNVGEDEYSKMTKAQQRQHLSRYFFSYTENALNKYKFSQLDITQFLKDLHVLCLQIGWVQDDMEC